MMLQKKEREEIMMRLKTSDKLRLISGIIFLSLVGCASATDSVFLKGWELPEYFITKNEAKKDPLEAQWRDSYAVKLKGATRAFTISSCADYLKVKDGVPKPLSSIDTPPFTFLCLQCEATSLALTANHGKKNYLKSIRFDDSLADILPSEIGFGQEIPAGKTWREVAGVSFVENAGVFLYFKSPVFGYYLYPIAFGDFDSDGYEDIIILVHTFSLKGNYVNNAAYVLSRKSDGVNLRVVMRITP